MQFSVRSKRLLFSGLVILVFGTLAFFATSSTLAWAGHKDLVVRFHVIDSKSGTSVSNAVIHIRAEGGGFCDDRESRESISRIERFCAEHDYVVHNVFSVHANDKREGVEFPGLIASTCAVRPV